MFLFTIWSIFWGLFLRMFFMLLIFSTNSWLKLISIPLTILWGYFVYCFVKYWEDPWSSLLFRSWLIVLKIIWCWSISLLMGISIFKGISSFITKINKRIKDYREKKFKTPEEESKNAKSIDVLEKQKYSSIAHIIVHTIISIFLIIGWIFFLYYFVSMLFSGFSIKFLSIWTILWIAIVWIFFIVMTYYYFWEALSQVFGQFPNGHSDKQGGCRNFIIIMFLTALWVYFVYYYIKYWIDSWSPAFFRYWSNILIVIWYLCPFLFISRRIYLVCSRWISGIYKIIKYHIIYKEWTKNNTEKENEYANEDKWKKKRSTKKEFTKRKTSKLSKHD